MDIIERLRNPWNIPDGVDRGKSADWEGALRDEAAHEIERLRDALKPFSSICGDEPWSDDETVSVCLQVGAFRRARNLLNEE